MVISECPSILETLSMLMLFASVTVVAKVCLAVWQVTFFVIPQISAISFKYAFIFWFEITGNTRFWDRQTGWFLYFSTISSAGGNRGMNASCLVFCLDTRIPIVPFNTDIKRYQQTEHFTTTLLCCWFEEDVKRGIFLRFRWRFPISLSILYRATCSDGGLCSFSIRTWCYMVIY